MFQQGVAAVVPGRYAPTGLPGSQRVSWRRATSGGTKRGSALLSFDWDAVAGIIAAVAAIVLHFLHVVEDDVLLSIALVLLALLFVRDLRRDRTTDRMVDGVQATAVQVGQIRQMLTPVDAILVGPHDLRSASARFASEASGDMVWFHVCLSMFRTQQLFDAMLRPAVENPRVTSIQFILNEGERDAWDRFVVPKLAECRGREKVAEPRWTTIEESVSMILSETESGEHGDALLSFWGEPFMAYSTRDPVPRYIFRVSRDSELLGRLADVERKYRLGDVSDRQTTDGR